MKKTLLFWSAAAVCLTLCACSKDETAAPAGPQPEPQPETERIYLATETGGSSRAGFAGEGYAIAWSEGDMVSVNATKAGGSRNECPMKRDEQGAWYIEAPKADVYHVVYPAIAGYEATDDTGAIIGNHVFLNDRAYQIYTPGSFDPERLVCYGAAAPGEKLTLRYLVALLKLTIRGATTDFVTAVTVTSGNGENIFASIGMCGIGPDGLPALSAGSYPMTSQTLRVEQPGGAALNEQGVHFYLALFPMTLSKGFTVQVDFANGTSQTFTASKAVELKRGRILAMPALTVANTAPPVFYSSDNTAWQPWNYDDDGKTPETLAYPASQKLYFKDNSDASTPGLTVAHLQSLADTFRNQDQATAKPIVLDMSQATLAGTTEFPSDIFCGACWNGTVNVAKADYSLKELHFPKNITRIADMSISGGVADKTGAFAGNHGLESVVIPAQMTYVGTGAFGLCRNLKTVTISGAGQPLTMGKFAFWGSMAITEVRCERTTPPSVVLDGTDSPFKQAGTTGIVFRVPAASLAAYKANAAWQRVIAEGSNRTWAAF